ncbi:MAG: sodium:solute symporter family transporter [Limisphaerales bacterium]
MISRYDYCIIGVYLIFLIAIGLAFRRMSKDTSDYFRAGGAMPWWITGTSAWIFSFSAWTFTGAAGKVYESGTLVLVVFYSTILALVVALIWTSLRFRRMRVITWMEAVRRRYGPFTEQFYIWIKLPLLLFFAGVALNAIGVFMAAVFQIHMNTLLVALGLVVTIVSFAGGSWAVLASDFVQACLIVTITICTATMVLARPEIGGISGLIHRVPASQFHWTELARPEFIILWILANLWFKFSDENNMERATMYLMTRSDKDARRMVLIPLIGTIIGPLVWFIPSMAATILHPNLAAEFPLLKHPHEAAFVAVSMDVMPKGLLGLLLCAMLGATVTSMDAGLNKNVGITIRSLYKPLFKPDASEKHLLIAGKICTLLFGAIIIAFALLVNRFRTMGLFDLANQLAANILMPLALPLIYGLFYKRTPGWSAWSTALVAGISSWLLGHYVTADFFQHAMGLKKVLSGDEKIYLELAATTFGTVIIGTAWYFFTSLFYKSSPPQEQERIETFFQDLRTPVDKHNVGGVQTTVYKLLGGLCLVYGAFILLLMLIPNRFNGRLCFLFCGGVIFTIGAILFRIAKRDKTENELK